MWITIAFLLCLATVLYLLEPLFIANTEATPSLASDVRLDKSALLDSKERSLRAIKDLELDFKMGKISREDYQISRNELSLEVAQVLGKLGE
jgi:hypothetical protein